MKVVSCHGAGRRHVERVKIEICAPQNDPKNIPHFKIVSEHSHMPNHLSNKPALRVAVVSIGRSGTSLIARILHEVLGVDFGDEAQHIPRNHNNPDGYFENAEFLPFNDRILQAAGGAVLSPPPIDYPATLDPATRDALTTEAVTLLAKYANGKPAFGWKDPRMSFTLPIWRAACPSVIPVIAFRKPVSVLSSIAAQLERPIDSLANLWLAYYQRVFAYTDGMPRYVVSFDDLLADPAPVVLGIARHLRIPVDGERVRAQLAQIVKPRQSRHSSAEITSNAAQLLDLQTNALFDYLRTSVADGGQPDRAMLQKLLP